MIYIPMFYPVWVGEGKGRLRKTDDTGCGRGWSLHIVAQREPSFRKNFSKRFIHVWIKGSPRTMLRCTIPALLAALISISSCSARSDCIVDNFQVKENFNQTRYAGKWYAFAKKDPEGLFLEKDIHADFKIENRTMIAKATGLVSLLPDWIVCAEMMGTFNNTANSAKFKLKYWGAAEYLQKGIDDHWIIDTDYDNYAITYTCRKLYENRTCADSYSFVFSRRPEGLTTESQRIVRKWQEHLCLAFKYKRVPQTGSCP